ncbi:hypothetical protein TNCV_2753381 [Trichonephila clavipes]|nr:hypothetical protein TNCV_2753381 [Trichonephila clavipes]
MDALKLRRTPLRTALTRAVNHLREIIENDPVDKNAVETAFEMLDAKGGKLKKIDEDILELMIESNCTQEAYNIEFEAIEGYTEKNDYLANPREKYHEDRCFGTERQPQPDDICVFPRFNSSSFLECWLRVSTTSSRESMKMRALMIETSFSTLSRQQLQNPGSGI